MAKICIGRRAALPDNDAPQPPALRWGQDLYYTAAEKATNLAALNPELFLKFWYIKTDILLTMQNY